MVHGYTPSTTYPKEKKTNKKITSWSPHTDYTWANIVTLRDGGESPFIAGCSSLKNFYYTVATQHHRALIKFALHFTLKTSSGYDNTTHSKASPNLSSFRNLWRCLRRIGGEAQGKVIHCFMRVNRPAIVLAWWGERERRI